MIEIFSTMPFLYIVIIIGSFLGFLNLFLIFISLTGLDLHFMRAEFLRLREVQFAGPPGRWGQYWQIMFGICCPMPDTDYYFFPFNLISIGSRRSDFWDLPAPTQLGRLMRQGAHLLTGFLFRYWPYPGFAFYCLCGEGYGRPLTPKNTEDGVKMTALLKLRPGGAFPNHRRSGRCRCRRRGLRRRY